MRERRDHNRGQNGHRQQRQPWSGGKHQQSNRNRRHHPRGSATRAGVLAGRARREPRAHRQPLQQTRQQIGRAQRRQLTVRIDGASMWQGQRADRTPGFGVQNDDQRKRQLADAHPFIEAERRQRQSHAAKIDMPDERDTMGRQVEQAGRGDPQAGDRKGPGEQRNALEQTQARVGGAADGDRPWVPVGDTLAQTQQQPRRRRTRQCHTRDMGQLVDHDGDGQAESKAAQHRPRDEGGQMADPGCSTQGKQDAGHQDQCAGQRQRIACRWSRHTQCCHRGGKNCSRR